MMTTPSPRSTDDLAPSTDGMPSVVADRYEVGELLGVGGMGQVFRVYDRVLDEQVALKVLHRELTENPEALARFRREVKLARRVTHPNVARVFDVSEHEGWRFLTMECVEGPSLDQLLDRHGPFDGDEVVEMALQICDGLLVAHRAGVIHRDLKPQNVIVQPDGRVVLTDFGIARATDALTVTRTQGTVGTPAYMAPEQVQSLPSIDGRADIYALGAVLYELLTGVPPWVGDSVYLVAAARLTQPPPDPRHEASVDDDLAEVIVRCMAREPNDRFVDVAELTEALRAIQQRRIRQSEREGSTTWRRSLALLTSGDTELVAGVHAVLVDGLRATRGLGFRPTPRDVVSRGALSALGVTSLLAVNASRHDDAVTLAAELREVPSGRVTWSTRHVATIDRVVDGALAIRDELARSLGVPEPPAFPRQPLPKDDAEMMLAGYRLHESWQGEEDNDRAIATFEAARLAQPDDPWINTGYAGALLRRYLEGDGYGYDLQDARSMAERALSEAPGLSSARAIHAETLLELGKPVDACREALEVLAMQPRNAKPLAVLGRAWLMVGDTERAIRCLESASELGEPRRVRNDLSIAYALAGRAGDATTLIDGATERERGVWHHWYCRARVALWTGDEAMQKSALEGVARTLFMHRDDLLPIVGALGGAGAPADAIRRLAELSRSTAEGLRRRAQLLATQIELVVARQGSHVLRKVEPSPVGDLLELSWLEGSPVMRPGRRSPEHRALNSQLTQAHAPLRQLLASSRH